MPTLRLYPEGMSGGVPPSVNTHQRAKRGVVGGWSSSSVRANTRFLYSVEVDRLDEGVTGPGQAFTLTVRQCPPTHEDWKRLREMLFRSLRRWGMVRLHWVTEWQRRGVPHLHGVVWFDSHGVGRSSQIVDEWCRIAADYRPLPRAQNVKPIHDALGWLQYLAKHASRGVMHYQRSAANVPRGWQRTGRMWGYLGEWPRREPISIGLSPGGWFAFRRLVRSWRYAKHRAENDKHGMRRARDMLQCGDRQLSEVRGVSEWLGLDESLTLLAVVAAAGHQVEQQFPDDES